MRIVRHDENVLELKGRREDKEKGAGGLWLVWMVGLAFCAVPLALLLFHGGLWVTDDAAVAIGCGIFGTAMLLFGVFRLLRREHLVMDLHRRRGQYWTWSPWEGPRSRCEFAFEQVDNVTIATKVEVVAAGDDLPGVYNKWEARLRIRPRTIIRIVRSGSEARVRTMADELCKALGVAVLDRTAKRVDEPNALDK